MGKTGQQIERDVFVMLQNSAVQESISGAIYQQGTRPQNSALEDAVVAFAGSQEGQIQQGTVHVNIYVPDTDGAPGGGTQKDLVRCASIEQSAQAWVQALREARSDYYFALEETISTQAEEKIPQHCIQIKLNFKLPSF